MPAVAVACWVFFVLVGLVLRSWLQRRWTGSSGFVGLRADASASERTAGLALVLAFVLSLTAPFVGVPVHASAALVAAGSALVMLATTATFWAQVVMRASWRIGVDPTERTELVTSGPFRVVRNPIFTAMLAASVGLALCCATPLALCAPLLALLALELQVRAVEEPYLTRVHGEPYLQWASRTGRFVPGLGLLR